MTPDREAVRSELNDGWKRLLLVLADMDEEEGNPDRAAGLRWLVENNKVPRKDVGGYKWYVMMEAANLGRSWSNPNYTDPEDIPCRHAKHSGWSELTDSPYNAYLQSAEIVGRWLREREEK